MTDIMQTYYSRFLTISTLLLLSVSIGFTQSSIQLRLNRHDSTECGKNKVWFKLEVRTAPSSINSTVALTSSSVLLNFDTANLQFSKFLPREFDKSYSARAATANWDDQQSSFLPFWGIFNLVMLKNEGGVNPYLLDTTRFVTIGLIEFNATTANAPSFIRLNHDHTHFYESANTALTVAEFPTFTFRTPNTTPLITASVTGDTSVCSLTDRTTLTASGGRNYLWSNSARTPAVTVGAGTYTVTVTNANNCTATRTVTVTAAGNATPVVVGDTLVCAGQTTTLTASGGTAYLWSNSARTPAVTVGAGTYTVTVTNANGCTATRTVTVTAAGNATPVVVGDTLVCAGQTTTLTASGGITYLWSNSARTPAVTVGAGTYTVTVTNANGCTATRTVIVGTKTTSITLSECPTNLVLSSPNGSCVSANWRVPTVVSNCGTPSVSSSVPVGHCFPVGTTTVTYTASLNGVSKQCSFTVTVLPNCNANRTNTIVKLCNNNLPILRGNELANYEYQWLHSTTSCPNNISQAISGATSQNYNLPTKVTQTTYFVRFARPRGCSTWGSITTSNCIAVLPSDCAATSQPCDLVQVSGSTNGRITVSNTGASVSQILVFNADWQPISSVLSYSSATTLTVRNGTHRVKIQMYSISPTGTWQFICEKTFINIVVSGGIQALQASTTTVLELVARPELHAVKLHWFNNTGYKNDYFEVEKQNPTTGSFEKIATLNSENSDRVANYNATDDNPTEGVNTYRIAAIGMDGKRQVSNIQNVKYAKTIDFGIFPNPTTDFIEVDLKQYIGQAATLYIYNQFGKVVKTEQIATATALPVRLDMSAETAGQYLVRVMSKGKRDAVKKFILTR
jgi:hypothetical protein